MPGDATGFLIISITADPSKEQLEIVRSLLFKEAQKHLSKLQRKEADGFARKLQELPDLAEPRVLKLERS